MKDDSKDSNKVVLITGAAKRIGATISKKMHEAGFNIVIHCHHSINEANDLAGELNHKRKKSATVITANLLEIDQVKSLAQKSISHWGKLDALINNASSFYPTPIGDITEENFDDLIGTNLKAPFFLSQACAEALKQQNGCIINIADIHGERPLSGYPVYCSAKAGNIMLTKSLAKELAPHVRVNSVAPGAILWPNAQAELSDEAKEIIIDRTALNRIGEPDDIATTIKFLITEAPYITGQILAVDGGRNLVS
ncbi:MAG: pteridine reductase [Cellvibrionaceae bacterium]